MKYSIHRRRIVAAAAAAMAAGFVRFPEVARSATPKEKVIGITTKRFEFNPSVITIKKGESIVFDKSPRWGNGAGGNPLVFVKLLDDAYAPISGEISLGRCNKI